MSSEQEALLTSLHALRADVARDAEAWLGQVGATPSPALVNLGAYLALRHRDLRPLQRQLMVRGLSSLGRLEGRVLPALDAVTTTLAAASGLQTPLVAPTAEAFFAGERRLEQATDRLFGAPAPQRRGRIMVTLEADLAEDPAFVLDLARRGLDVARINCAHDDRAAWRLMVENVRSAGQALGRDLRVLMDIAGPKLRTEEVLALDPHDRLVAGARLRLLAASEAHVSPEVPFAATVSAPELVTRAAVGDVVRYDDGKVEGRVERTEPGSIVVVIERARARGVRLKAEKGLNLPDTELGLSPLTAKDDADLDAVIELADLLGYSFVRRASDLDLLEEALARRRIERPLGLVAKIERPEAVRNLPELMARALGRRPLGIMIARGDLGAELGFERLAEMQEEILWLCEAASVPAIWATQVLEGLVKDGVPSRGELTDAAMAARAECVMLNKGPEIGAAVDLLDHLLGRMEGHALKKTPTLRALATW